MRVPAAILIAACTLAAGCTALTGRSRDRDRDRYRTVPATGRDREVDGRKVAGGMQVKPPQSHLRLELSEDRVSSVTPPLPPPPGLGPFDARGPADPPLPGPPPLDPPAPPMRKENVAGTPSPPP